MMPERIRVEDWTADATPLIGSFPTTNQGWETPTNEYVRADLYDAALAQLAQARVDMANERQRRYAVERELGA